MMHFFGLIKTAAHFSKKISRTNLSFWLSIGPFFLLALFSTAFLYFSEAGFLFSLLFLLSLIFSVRFGIKGFLIAFVCLCVYFIFGHSFLPQGSLFWKNLFAFSLLLGLFLTALIGEEVRHFLEKQWQIKDENAFELSQQKLQVQKLKQEHEAEKLHLKSSVEMLGKQHVESLDYSNSLKTLIAVTEKESKALRDESQELKKTCEIFHAEIENLKKGIEQNDRTPGEHFLDELNQFRVENYQLRILIESYENELKKYKKMDAEKNRLLFEKNQSEHQKKKQLDFLEDETQGEELRKIIALTGERNDLKRKYEKLLEDYDRLNKRLEDHFHRESDEDYSQLKIEFDKKNEAVSLMRSELFKLEGELLFLRKEQDEHEYNFSQIEKSLHDYLNFTDQECLRLEEENRQLREIIDTIIKPIAE